jgi:hypothetical protein
MDMDPSVEQSAQLVVLAALTAAARAIGRFGAQPSNARGAPSCLMQVLRAFSSQSRAPVADISLCHGPARPATRREPG